MVLRFHERTSAFMQLNPKGGLEVFGDFICISRKTSACDMFMFATS